jgi:Rrf2 family protein
VISQTAEYALRAVVHLAAGPSAPRTTRQIAAATRVPAPFLSKVMQGLGRAGLVRSQRGLRGGFKLARDPAELTILDVVNAVDPLRRIRGCPLDLPEHGLNLCPLHRRLDDAAALVEDAFRQTTVAELLPAKTRRPRVCRFPDLAVV